jgi:hypothetical protein
VLTIAGEEKWAVEIDVIDSTREKASWCDSQGRGDHATNHQFESAFSRAPGQE